MVTLADGFDNGGCGERQASEALNIAPGDALALRDFAERAHPARGQLIEPASPARYRLEQRRIESPRGVLSLLKTPKAARSLSFGKSQHSVAACSSMCIPSWPLSPAGSAVGPFLNWKTSLSVISCIFFAGNGRVGLGCLRSTVCSGSGSIDYGRAVWTRWCWSSRPPSSDGTVRAFAFLALALEIRTAVGG